MSTGLAKERHDGVTPYEEDALGLRSGTFDEFVTISQRASELCAHRQRA